MNVTRLRDINLVKLLAKPARYVVLPACLYLAGFMIFTYPLIGKFSSHVWAGLGDGLQMVWNTWWVDRAVTDLHQLPWYTRQLFFPVGTPLIMHTMHPFTGFLAIGLLRILTLVETYNALIIVSFVLSGMTLFWLAYDVSRRYWPAILGGAVFTFSNYHFGHAQGHMQLVSMQWIPLFLLLFKRVLEKPRPITALGAGLALFLTALCDFYYCFFCIMAGGLIVAWYSWTERDWVFVFRGHRFQALTLFCLTSLVTTGPLIMALLYTQSASPAKVTFWPALFSLDPLGLLIPGGHWRFADWSRFYWQGSGINIHENSVHLGLSVLVLIACAAILPRVRQRYRLGAWWLLLFFFGVMALGPRLTVLGHELRGIPMPYVLMHRLVPALRLGARPIRMVVMTILSASVILSCSVPILWDRGKAFRCAIAGLLLLMAFEYWPSVPVAYELPLPPYVAILRDQEGPGAVLDVIHADTTASRAMAMYHQTYHEKPLTLAYVSRDHQHTLSMAEGVFTQLEEGDYASLNAVYSVQYLLMPKPVGNVAQLQDAMILWQDEDTILYDLGVPPALGSQ
jgi:hypothetical protein